MAKAESSTKPKKLSVEFDEAKARTRFSRRGGKIRSAILSGGGAIKPEQNKEQARTANRQTGVLSSKVQPRLEDVLSRKYEHNFLDKVIVRVDFATPITLSLELRKKLVKAHKATFPVFEEGQLVEGEFAIGSSGTIESKPLHSAKTWKFNGHGKSLAVSDHYCWVEYVRYESYEKLSEELFGLLKVIFKAESDLQAKRLGLRYVDKLDFSDESNPTDWSEYLCPALLAPFDLAEDRSLISRAFNVLELNYGDGLQLRFQYGMLNPDHPAAIRRKVYILDHDVFATGVFDHQEIEGLFGKLRFKAKESFERIIADGLRKKMGVKK